MSGKVNRSGGKRPGAGRPKGSKNRRTKLNRQRDEKIVAAGKTPLEYLLDVMRNARVTADRRLEAAKAAAPYVHPKLAQTELKGELNTRNMTDEQLRGALAELLQDPAVRAAIGRNGFPP